jgi:hypothetical protein
MKLLSLVEGGQAFAPEMGGFAKKSKEGGIHFANCNCCSPYRLPVGEYLLETFEDGETVTRVGDLSQADIEACQGLVIPVQIQVWP